MMLELMSTIVYMMFRSWDGIGCFLIITGLACFFTWRLFLEAISIVETWFLK